MPADQQRHSKALVRTEIAGIAEAVISSYTLMMIEVGDLSGVAFDVMKYFSLLFANIVQQRGAEQSSIGTFIVADQILPCRHRVLTNRVLMVRVIMFQLGETKHKGINLVVAIFVTHDPDFIPTLRHHGNIEFEVHLLDYRLRDRTFPIIVALQTHLIGRRHEKTYCTQIMFVECSDTIKESDTALVVDIGCVVHHILAIHQILQNPFVKGLENQVLLGLVVLVTKNFGTDRIAGVDDGVRDAFGSE